VIQTKLLITLLALGLLLAPAPGLAQEATGRSEIFYDSGSNTVTMYASTEINYSAAAYYDLWVEGFLYETNGRGFLGRTGMGYSSVYYVSVGLQATAVPGKSYLAHGEHYVDAYYYYQNFVPDCYQWCNSWWDGYGFSLISTPPGYGPPYNPLYTWSLLSNLAG
jgi:hypothetical protein